MYIVYATTWREKGKFDCLSLGKVPIRHSPEARVADPHSKDVSECNHPWTSPQALLRVGVITYLSPISRQDAYSGLVGASREAFPSDYYVDAGMCHLLRHLYAWGGVTKQKLLAFTLDIVTTIYTQHLDNCC